MYVGELLSDSRSGFIKWTKMNDNNIFNLFLFTWFYWEVNWWTIMERYFLIIKNTFLPSFSKIYFSVTLSPCTAYCKCVTEMNKVFNLRKSDSFILKNTTFMKSRVLIDKYYSILKCFYKTLCTNTHLLNLI